MLLLQVFVTFVLRRLLPEHHRWRYASRAERWRVAGAALRMLRHALQAPTVQPAVEDVLRYDVGVAATLLPALPPNARQLEVGNSGSVAAFPAEQWQRDAGFCA